MKRRAAPRSPVPRSGTCTWCQGPVTPPRRSWCSDACVDEYRIRREPAYARDRVFDRDHGVCALCGLRTEEVRIALASTLNEAKRLFERPRPPPRPYGMSLKAWRALPPPPDTRDFSGSQRAYGHFERLAARYGVKVPGWDELGGGVAAHVPHLWEMDHIVPVVEGGGGCGLNNLRTLCRLCHREATADLSRRRARERRIQRRREAPHAEMFGEGGGA